MMIRTTLTAAALAMLLVSPAWADDDQDRGVNDRYEHRYDRNDRNDRKDDRQDDSRDDRWRDDNDSNRGRTDDDRDGRRDDDRRRHDDWRDHDNWRRDGWRYDRGRDDNNWSRGRDRRYAPPDRYRADYGYRYGYELAWRDWDRHGRHDRRWHRRPESRYRFDFGYLSGYEAGWRDAEYYFGYGYRPSYWSRDPYGSWFFSFSLSG